MRVKLHQSWTRRKDWGLAATVCGATTFDTRTSGVVLGLPAEREKGAGKKAACAATMSLYLPEESWSRRPLA